MLIGKIKPTNHYKKLSTNKSVIINNESIISDYYITFRINNKCNLACEYCHWHNGNNYDVKDIKETIDNIVLFSIKKSFKVITFYFHGGEPSFHPNVLEILEYIREKEKISSIKIIIEFQTNLSLNNYLEIEKYIDFFDVSYHYIELKKTKKLDVFDNNMKKINKTKLLNLDIMLENIEDDVELSYFYEKVKEYIKYPFQNSEMIYGFCHYKYNEETKEKHLNFYKEYNKSEQLYLIDDVEYSTNDLFKQGLNCKDMQCDAGKQNIVINGDGNVFICGIDMTNFTNRCSDTTPFTNIRTDKMAINKLIILSKTGMKCKWEYCGGDFYLGKEFK